MIVAHHHFGLPDPLTAVEHGIPLPAGQRIDPPELRNGDAYDRMASDLPTTRSTALERFKKQYPEHFVDNPADERAHEIFLKWQKAFQYWEGGYSIRDEHRIHAECPQEIQAIRSHLNAIILDETAAKFERENENSTFRTCCLAMHSLISARWFQIAMLVLSIAIIVLVIVI